MIGLVAVSRRFAPRKVFCLRTGSEFDIRIILKFWFILPIHVDHFIHLIPQVLAKVESKAESD